MPSKFSKWADFYVGERYIGRAFKEIHLLDILDNVSGHLNRSQLIGRAWGKPSQSYKALVSFSEINPYWVSFFRLEKRRFLDDSIALELRRQAEELDKVSFDPPQIPTAEVVPAKSRYANLQGFKKSRYKGSAFPRGQVEIYPINDLSNPGQFRIVNFDGIDNLISTSFTRRYYKTRSSVKTPGFRSIKKKDLPWNNYSQVAEIATEDSGTAANYFSGRRLDNSYGFLNTYYGAGPENIHTVISSPSYNEVSDEALIKCLGRSKSMKINLAQAYAERKQTANLLYSSVNRLLSLAIALRKGDVKRARELINHNSSFSKKNPSSRPPKSGRSQGYSSSKKHYYKGSSPYTVLDYTGVHTIGRRYGRIRKPSVPPSVTPSTFANLWLEFQYGWRPLLSDIYGAAEQIADTYYRRKPTEVAASASNSFTRSLQVGSHYVLGTQFVQIATTTDKVSARCLFQFGEDDNTLSFATKTGLTNPALLAWELVPYSFVVDWFVPIGTYLSNIDALVGMNFTRASRSIKIDSVTTTKWVKTTTNPDGRLNPSFSPGKVTYKRESKSRSIGYAPPTPPMPQLKPKLGSERILSAISLLTQVFSQGKTSLK